MTSIEELKALGLTIRQAKLYIAALELSPASAAMLAKKAGIERSASYTPIEELVAMGLLSVLPNRGKRLFAAQNPQKLGDIVKNRQEIYSKLLPELMSVFNTKGLKPKVRYYEGQEGMRTILNNSIKPGIEEKYHFNPVENILGILGEEFSRRHIEERVERGIRLKVLRPKKIEEGPWELTSEDESLLREVRYLSKDFKLDNLIIVYGNTVAIISSARENYGLEIESKEYADSMKSLFDLTWARAGK